MSKFLAKKRLSNESLSECVPQGYKHGVSFNEETTYNEAITKLIIVGTFTPFKGQEAGYFYTSPKNNIYRYIDSAFNDGYSLVQLKNELIKKPKDEKILEEIKKVLIERKIAFLDVVKEANYSLNDSKDDSLEYVLDKETFKGKDLSKVKVIANSRNAQKALEYILEKEVDYLPQSLCGTRGTYKNQKELDEKWKETISKICLWWLRKKMWLFIKEINSTKSFVVKVNKKIISQFDNLDEDIKYQLRLVNKYYGSFDTIGLPFSLGAYILWWRTWKR